MRKENLMRYRAAIPLLSVFLGLLLANVYQWPQPAVMTTAAASFGTKGLGYWYKNPASPKTSLVRTPTGEKPQSKLWYNDGFWWADLFNNVSGNYHIYRLNTQTQTWMDTGTVLDTRPETKADCLWDGAYLYVVSGGGSDPNHTGTLYPYSAQLYRYSYNPVSKSYSLDFGPVLVRNGGAETIVVDKDSTGMLWITYTQNSKVYVNHSRATDSDWDATAAKVIPGAPATATSLSPDDISTLVAFDGKIGVLWSNESPGQFSGSSDTAFYFAYHVDGAPDTAWATAPIYRQPAAADDHLNIKSLQADPSGNLFAMIKTSFNTSTSPQLLLIVAKKSGNGYAWSSYVESTHNDNQTRPLLLINISQRMLYVFTSTEGGGDVYYKSTSMDNPSFASQPGPGKLFMTASGFALNNITGTKQTVNTSTGIVILASHDNDTGGADSVNADYYFHNYLDLNTTGPTVTPNPLTPTTTATPTRTPIPTATPTIGPRNTNKFVYLPLTLR
jgi:hypothetical protein